MKTTLYLTLYFLFNSFLTFSQNALNFDGVNDHVLTNVAGVNGSSARTIEARIKTTANALPAGSGGTGQKVIVDWGGFTTGGRFTFNLLWANAIRLEVGGNGISGTIPVNDGNWHHVAVVYDPIATNTISLYVDGVLDVAGTPTIATNTSSTNDIRIGSRIDNAGRFEGDIEEVRVWNVAKTQTELQANMNDELCNLPASLILYCPLNEGTANGTNTSVTQTADYSPNSGVCTLTNFALTGTTSNWVTGFTYGPGFIIGGSSTVSNCGTYTWPANGQFYQNSGFYQTSIPSTTGCDSIIGLNLTVNVNTFATQVESTCASYTWPVNGQTYSTSGIFGATIPNAAGCDSIVNLALTITGPILSSEDITACDTYTWPVNGQTYTNTISVVDTLTTSQGCDSIVTLNLTIMGASSTTQTVTSCGDYYWAADSMTYTSTGTWSTTLVNASGCDSVVTLDLTVQPSLDLTITNNGNQDLTANQSGAQYQWIDCFTDSSIIVGETNQILLYANVSNGYFAVIITLNGCTDTSECMWLAWESLDEYTRPVFELSPNPNSGSFEISSESNINGVIRILDTKGKIIHIENVYQTQSHKMDITHLNDGLYFVQIQSENGNETLRLVKRN